jgi:hypothetical protein
MKYRKYLVFILLISFFACRDDEDPEKEILPSIETAVNALAVDKYNTKWIGTDDGLYKSVADGYELQDIAGDKKITALYYEEGGDILWIGSSAGLLKATVSVDKITAYSIDSVNLSNPEVRAIHVDQDTRRWFGTAKGISLTYDEQWKKENFRVNRQGTLFAMDLENYPINSIASAEGEYYFATGGARLYRAVDYDPEVDAFSGATQWCVPYNGLSVTDTMFVVFIDQEGKQWMGARRGSRFIQVMIRSNRVALPITMMNFRIHASWPSISPRTGTSGSARARDWPCSMVQTGRPSPRACPESR